MDELRHILEFGMQVALRYEYKFVPQHLLNERKIAGFVEHVRRERVTR